jgi:hypothetical protein
MGTEFKLCRDQLSNEHRAPSLGEHRNKRKVKKRRQGPPSTGILTELTGEPTRYVALSNVNSIDLSGEPTRYVALPNVKRMNYAEAVQVTKTKTYKITVISTGAHRQDEIKQILKPK